MKTVDVRSLNLICYLRYAGEQIELLEDEENKGLYYAKVDTDILNKHLDSYRSDKALVEYVGTYRELRKEIARRRLEDK
jgi:hypothetical protein